MLPLYGLIGFDPSDGDALLRHLATMGSRPTDVGRDGRRLLWHDSSGAAIAVYVNEDGKIVCARPGFIGRSSLTVVGKSLADDPAGCPYCTTSVVSVIERDDSIYPLPVRLLDAHEGDIAAGDATTLAIGLFVTDHFVVWPDEDAHAADDSDYARFATRSAVPTGLLACV